MLQSSKLVVVNQSVAGANLSTLSALLELEMRDMLRHEQADKPLRTGVHASNILVPESDWCLRRWVLTERFPERAEKPESMPWEWKSHLVFESGWDLHQTLQQLFLNQGVAVFNSELHDYELDLTHLDEEFQLHFSPDAIIEWAGTRYVVEIKGYKQETYAEMLADPKPPHAAHMQCNLYLHFLRMRWGIILVVNKNTQDFFIRVIEYDRALAMPYLDRLFALKTKRVTGNNLVPGRKCSSASDPLARGCPMRRLCFEMTEEYNGKAVQIFTTR